MATKKQKHEAAMAKREKFLAEVRADGLRAQKASREAEKKRSEEIKAAAEKVNKRYRDILIARGIIPGTGVAYDKKME
jgi:Skp family chaperone for outer membrane proteins